MYFGQQEEEAILKYLATRDEDFYVKEIHPLLYKIAWGVVKKTNFKPHSLFRSRGVIDGCVNHLWEVLTLNFDPQKGSRAFSFLTYCAHSFYCSVASRYKRSQSFQLTRNETILEMWELSHGALPSPEETGIEGENKTYRIGVAHDFLETFGATPKELEKIMEEIDGLDNPHKKKINEIINRVLRLAKLHRSPKGIKKSRCNQPTKRLRTNKKAFLEKIKYYKSIGHL